MNRCYYYTVPARKISLGDCNSPRQSSVGLEKNNLGHLLITYIASNLLIVIIEYLADPLALLEDSISLTSADLHVLSDEPNCKLGY